MKKLAILLTILMLLLTSMVPAMAEDDAATVDITVTTDGTAVATGSTFAAYRLLNLTTSLKCEENHVHDADTCYRYAYTVNSAYQSILAAISGKMESADIVNYISALGESGIVSFADTVYRAILTADPTIVADKVSDNGTIQDAEQGYYLIVETDKAADDTVYSKAMLDTKGKLELKVKTKKNIPTVGKEVKDENDSTDAVAEWKDSADHDIGDAIDFRLTGTLPADYSSYITYKYEFVDTLPEGLTVPTEEGKVTGLKVYAVNKVKEDGAQTETEVKVDIPAENYSVTYTPDTEDATKNVLKVSFADLKAIKNAEGETIPTDAATKIVVEYSAVLNEEAKIGAEGNPNDVYLVFSNNPYGDGTGKTIKDEVTVFTFEAIVNKVGEDETTPLKGAGFTLYKWDADAPVEGSDETGAWVAVGGEIKGEEITTFTFTGIDEGTYKIEETTVPSGYNKAADIEFKVVASYAEEDDPDTLAGLTVKANGSDDITISTTLGEDGKPLDENKAFITNFANGTVSTTIVNTTGMELPSTGGIGITIFYVGGGLLVLAALALMLTRKCMRCPK